MIDWAAPRLARPGDDEDLYVNGISVGSERYLKAAAVLQVLEAEEQLARDQANLPAGVVASRRQAELPRTGPKGRRPAKADPVRYFCICPALHPSGQKSASAPSQSENRGSTCGLTKRRLRFEGNHEHPTSATGLCLAWFGFSPSHT